MNNDGSRIKFRFGTRVSAVLLRTTIGITSLKAIELSDFLRYATLSILIKIGKFFTAFVKIPECYACMVQLQDQLGGDLRNRIRKLRGPQGLSSSHS